MLGRLRLANPGRTLARVTVGAALLGAALAGAGSAAAQPKPPAPPPAPGPPPPAPAPADESTTPSTAPVAEANDVDALRQEYLKLRDELFASRARAATIASALYSTRIQVKLKFTTERFWGVSRAMVRLDGAGVFDDTSGAVAKDDAVRFDGWIAPGRHLVTVRLELLGKDDDRFTTATESTFVVEAVAGKDLQVNVRSSDDGDLPYQWKKSQRGGYRLGLDVDVKTTARPTAPAAASRTPARRAAEAPRAR
ncbi:MAG: hypothetical protein R3B06_30020 [Kofleriaceae bacterium]